MKLLLDTHTFLWLVGAPDKVSQTAFQACRNPENELWLSLVSLWEIQIKVQLRKLRLDAPLPEIVESQLTGNRVQLLPIEPQHIYHLDVLPPHHRDPFDRLLITQALVTGAHLVTQDSTMPKYPVKILW